ncbi:MAG TPA: hypothetical protein VF116_06535 [Ktedonobacterales bacterium]
MRTIGRYISELFTALVQGCLVMAIVAAVIATGAYFVAEGQMPHGIAVGLIIAIVVLSGIIGALVMLVWRLTHLREISHVAQRIVNAGQQNSNDR